MADPSKQNDDGFKQLTVRWDAADWRRIEEAAETLNAREHMDLNPTDIIRSGTRRFVDEILSQPHPVKL